MANQWPHLSRSRKKEIQINGQMQNCEDKTNDGVVTVDTREYIQPSGL